jgi:RHS repeat-associated protein
VVWKATNYPFEREVVQDDIGGLNLGFPGQYYDAERGLWNNGYRNYSAGFGRYIESDPAGLGSGVNTYAYVGGSPLANVDPYGLWQFSLSITLDPFGIGPGGVLTFGYNHGQFNIGGWLGGSAGDSASLNLNNMPCHKSGSFMSTRADGKISALGGVFSTSFSSQLGPEVNTTEFSTGVPFVKPLETGFSIDDGKVSPMPEATIVEGESAFLGSGGQWYW